MNIVFIQPSGVVTLSPPSLSYSLHKQSVETIAIISFFKKPYLSLCLGVMLTFLRVGRSIKEKEKKKE